MNICRRDRATTRLTAEQRAWLADHRRTYRVRVALERGRYALRRQKIDDEGAYIIALRKVMMALR